eukprot:10527544-Prorocentrum_lima.AAC.1
MIGNSFPPKLGEHLSKWWRRWTGAFHSLVSRVEIEARCHLGHLVDGDRGEEGYEPFIGRVFDDSPEEPLTYVAAPEGQRCATCQQPATAWVSPDGELCLWMLFDTTADFTVLGGSYESVA